MKINLLWTLISIGVETTIRTKSKGFVRENEKMRTASTALLGCTTSYFFVL